MKATIDIVKTIWENKAIRISLIAFGIIVSCVAYSILEEQIMKKCYEQDSDGKCVEGGEQNELKYLNIRTLGPHLHPACFSIMTDCAS